MHSITGFLFFAAFVLTLISAAGKVPTWVPLLIVTIGLLLSYLPL